MKKTFLILIIFALFEGVGGQTVQVIDTNYTAVYLLPTGWHKLTIAESLWIEKGIQDLRDMKALAKQEELRQKVIKKSAKQAAKDEQAWLDNRRHELAIQRREAETR
jgi:hypothetical protein